MSAAVARAYPLHSIEEGMLNRYFRQPYSKCVNTIIRWFCLKQRFHKAKGSHRYEHHAIQSIH